MFAELRADGHTRADVAAALTRSPRSFAQGDALGTAAIADSLTACGIDQYREGTRSRNWPQ